MFDIVSLKSDIFKHRFSAEYGAEREPDNEEVLKHEIEKVREELFNMSFDENQGKDIMQKFRYNFQRLKDFMESVDKEIGSLAIFNEKEETFEDSMSKFSGITSIQ